MRFFNFFLNHMLQKYQNEISPIIYYGISTKINEKDLKIPILQPPDWKSPYWMSLYMPIYRTFFVWEFISPAESPVAGGWRMIFKGTTLDPDSNCNWVITKLSTLFGKLECEAFNSKVTFYITFMLHFLHLLPPSL